MKIRYSFTVILGLLANSAWAGKVELASSLELLAFDQQEDPASLVINDTNKHQVVVRLAKVIHFNNSEERLFESDPFIITFRGTKENITISTPKINNEKQVNAFNENPVFLVKTSSNQTIPAVVDKLKLTGFLPMLKFEEKLIAYNNSNQKASVVFSSKSAHSQPTIEQKPLSQSQQLASATDSQQIEKDLKILFIRADKATQQRFLKWAKAQK